MKQRLKSLLPTIMFISGISFLIASIVMIAIYFNSTAPFYDKRYTPTDFYHAEVIEVYTGDTALVDVDLGFDMRLYSVSIKLDSIDAPELIEPMGELSRDYLSNAIKGEKIVIKSDSKDEFGRWLVEVYDDGKNLNDELVERDLAKPYDE